MFSADRLFSCWFLTLVIVLTTALHAAAQDVSPRYADSLLAEKQQSYPKGILSNFREVILPNLDPDEREQLKDVIFEFPLRLKGREPMAFVSIGGGQKRILMSVQSLKFLDDILTAFTWLNESGYSLESAFNYLSMIRHWNGPGQPPLPWKALCVPANVLEDSNIDGRSQDFLRTAVFFIMVHELGHVLHDHPGNAAVPPSQSRSNEAQADAFALRVMSKVGDLPTGIPNLFLIMSYLSETVSDQDANRLSESERLMRTHPLSSERLLAYASNFEATAHVYKRSGLSSLQIAALAAQITTVANYYEETQRLSAFIGPNTSAEDLGPVKRGEKLGMPCDGWPPAGEFSGYFTGKTTVRNVEFDIGVEMRRDGNRVTGRYSFGLGFAKFEGSVSGNELTYDWRTSEQSGTGRLVLQNGIYSGRWQNPVNGDAGTITLAASN